MADIQSAAAEIRRGKKRRKKERTNHSMKIYMVSLFHRATIKYTFTVLNLYKLECGPMPNVMAALPNIGGGLCSTPQSLVDAHY